MVHLLPRAPYVREEAGTHRYNVGIDTPKLCATSCGGVSLVNSFLAGLHLVTESGSRRALRGKASALAEVRRVSPMCRNTGVQADVPGLQPGPRLERVGPDRKPE